MIKEVLLVHHSHTDIGYTHPQPTVFELHNRFIDAALDLADASQDAPEDARFRWTCEVTGTTRRWWDAAGESQRQRFVAAVARGQMEVAAMQWHLTPLADARMLVRSLDSVRFFIEHGVPVRSAMDTDVNGVPWGLVDILLDHGIDGFSMSSNSHFGAPATPRPGAFRWASPDGREIVVWNGFQYWHAANVKMGLPQGIEHVEARMLPFLEETVRNGYPFEFLPVQITNPHHPDNAGPDPTLSTFVEEWNRRDSSVRLRTILLTELFDRLREQDLPTMRGDWTDYWNFGAGSSARETTVYLEGLRVLDTAHTAGALAGGLTCSSWEHLDQAHENLALYAEHTWGADCSILAPESIETRTQWAMKAAYPYLGMSHARIVRRDALESLAVRAGGDDTMALLFNPCPKAVSAPVAVPASGFEWYVTPGLQHRQRLEGLLTNLPNPSTATQAARWIRAELPGLGYRAARLGDLPSLSSNGLSVSADSLASDRVRVEFASAGEVTSLKVDGVEFVGNDPEFLFGVPVHERPEGGSRREIMALDFERFEPADGWNSDWKAIRAAGTLVESRFDSPEGAVEATRVFAMPNGDRVTTVVRLFAGEPSVDLEVLLDSVGDASPYSLALPFPLPKAGPTQWHFDTAGAVVRFDDEQLPNTCRHFVTTRRFVRMQTRDLGMSIATPDLPLWKFGGMFFDQTRNLDPGARRPVMLAWLANNYWEVNFLADQRGRTRYRMRLIPHAAEPLATSYERALPFFQPPHLHLYREHGPLREPEGALLGWDAQGVSLEFLSACGRGTLVVAANLLDRANELRLTGVNGVMLATTAGEPIRELEISGGLCRVPLLPRALLGLLVDSSRGA